MNVTEELIDSLPYLRNFPSLFFILGGPWRIGKPSDLENWKDTSIFMRLSRQNDAKPILQDNDLSKKNFELRKYFFPYTFFFERNPKFDCNCKKMTIRRKNKK